MVISDNTTNCFDFRKIEDLELRREFSKELYIADNVQIIKENMICEAATRLGLNDCNFSIRWTYLIIGKDQTEQEFDTILFPLVTGSKSIKIKVILRVTKVTLLRPY